MRIAIASGVSAIVLFFFGFLWWGVLMPIVRPAEVISDSTFVEKMGTSLKNESGLYFYPNYSETDHEESGPMAILYYNANLPSMPTMMGMGFAHMLLSSLLVATFVSCISRPIFLERFAFVLFLGLFVAVWADVGNMIWWRHPIGWTAFHFAYDVLSWALAGLVIASIVKPDLKAAGA